MKLHKIIPGVFVALAMSIASPVGATTLTCGSGDAGDVEFTLTISSGSIDTCVTGNGTLNKLPKPYDEYVFLDSDPDTTVASPQEEWFTITGSTFTIAPSAWTGYSSLALMLQLPTSSPKPDWAVFILSGGVLSGSWSNTGAETFDTASLYGGAPLSPTPVPESGSLLVLLGIGLVGIAGFARTQGQLQ